MNLSLLFDAPSLVLVLSSLLIGFVVGGRNVYKSLNLSKAISIPLGACGTLIGLSLMLIDLEDPSVIGPAITVAALPSIYGLLLSIVLDAIVSRINSPVEASSNQLIQVKTIGGCLLVVAIPIVISILYANPTVFIDVYAIVIVLIGAPSLTFLAAQTIEKRIEALGKYSLLISLFAVLCSIALLFTQWHDPTLIGPTMAIGLLSLLYGGILYTLSQVMHHSLYEKALSFSVQGNSVYLASTIFVGGSLFLMIMYSFA